MGTSARELPLATCFVRCCRVPACSCMQPRGYCYRGRCCWAGPCAPSYYDIVFSVFLSLWFRSVPAWIRDYMLATTLASSDSPASCLAFMHLSGGPVFLSTTSKRAGGPQNCSLSRCASCFLFVKFRVLCLVNVSIAFSVLRSIIHRFRACRYIPSSSLGLGGRCALPPWSVVEALAGLLYIHCTFPQPHS